MSHATICCHLACQNHVTNIWVIVIIMYCSECLELVLGPSHLVKYELSQCPLSLSERRLLCLAILILCCYLFFIFHVTYNVYSTVLSPKYPSLCRV